MNKLKQKRKAFISGKVSGKKWEDAHWLFNAGERWLRKHGYATVNPTKICDRNWSWWHCMYVCLRELSKCDTIAMLHDWKHSRGAKIEYAFALLTFKKIIYI